MTRKLEKCALRVNDGFSDRLSAAFKKQFDRELEVRFNFVSMQLVSAPTDGQPYTPDQHQWVAAFSDGYAAALEIVRDMDFEESK